MQSAETGRHRPDIPCKLWTINPNSGNLSTMLPTANADLPFEFTIQGAPLSLNNNNPRTRRRWCRLVRQSAQRRWTNRQPISQNVMVTITCFFNGSSAPFDVDNVPKRILDALKRMIVHDDGQVTDLICRKRNLDDNLQVSNLSQVLLSSLTLNVPFIHIVFAPAPYLEVP
jgi:Holliday junction resolvase RusA-like endonuclease